MSKNFKFIKELLKYSINNNNFIDAKKEWFSCEIFFIEFNEEEIENNPIDSEEDENIYFKIKFNIDIFEKNKCICGHEIKEHCIIENKLNKKRICVGNCCINLIDSEKYKLNSNAFKSLRIIKKDNDKKPNKNLLEISLNKKFITTDDFNYIMILKTYL